MDRTERQRLIELVGLVHDEVISKEQFQELDLMLRDSGEARKLYQVYITGMQNIEAIALENSALSGNAALPNTSNEELAIIDESIEEVTVVPTNQSNSKSFPNISTRFWWSVAALLLVSASVSAWSFSGQTPSNRAPYARVAGMINVSWTNPNEYFLLGEHLENDRIQIQSGVIDIDFRSGARVALRGPAVLDIKNENEGFLHRGQMVAYVPKPAEGFIVNTPHSEIVDLGTEFGMNVDSTSSSVHVFNGEVKYTTKKEEKQEQTLLTAGLAVLVDVDGKAIPVALKERSFEVPRQVLFTSYQRANSITAEFSPGNTTRTSAGVPGRIGEGWTNHWVFDCDGDKSATGALAVVEQEPLQSGMGPYLEFTANSKVGEKYHATAERGFESSGSKLDSSKPYVVQCMLRVNSPLENIEEICLRDRSYDGSISAHSWEFVAKRQVNADGEITKNLQWQDLPLRSIRQLDELVVREDSDRPGEEESNCSVLTDIVYRVVVEVRPDQNRHRVSLSDGVRTFVGDWTECDSEAHKGDRLERRLHWEVIGSGEVSISIDSIRIQNESKFEF
ncbi:MAG: FecR family protein [Planctomycetota bacterium]